VSDATTLADTVAANLQAVRSRLERAAVAAGRSPADIRLVAVSKTFGPDRIRAAAAAGQLDFGENKVQEALAKMPALADLPLRWHLIGHLQSNKARKAVGPFALLQSVDSLDLLLRLDRIAAETGRQVDVLVQLDLAGEPTKFGLPPGELDGVLDAARNLEHARVRGLMLLPPWFDDPEQARPYFRRLREIRDRQLDRGVPPELLRDLSMGMSHDFEVAVAEGATIVRVGTAIFGRRAAPA
jgi:pyridoxal phosphate enzyme (YggS family)